MNDSLLLGIAGAMLPLPRGIWRRKLAGDARRLDKLLGFMSGDHHRVRNFAVRELARAGVPLQPSTIAARLALSLPRVLEILDDLQRHMFFIFRNPAGEVTWAYPVTVDQTPHRLTFSGSERINAA